MTASTATQPPVERPFPPVTQLAMGSLALVIIGGIYMVGTFSSGPSLVVPTVLLTASAVLWLVSLLLLPAPGVRVAGVPASPAGRSSPTRSSPR